MHLLAQVYPPRLACLGLELVRSDDYVRPTRYEASEQLGAVTCRRCRRAASRLASPGFLERLWRRFFRGEP